jgi:hypothetical protein
MTRQRLFTPSPKGLPLKTPSGYQPEVLQSPSTDCYCDSALLGRKKLQEPGRDGHEARTDCSHRRNCRRGRRLDHAVWGVQNLPTANRRCEKAFRIANRRLSTPAIPLTRLPPHLGLLRVFPVVTFPPHLLYNSPRLNDLASRSNEYLTSKRFLLTTAARSVLPFRMKSAHHPVSLAVHGRLSPQFRSDSRCAFRIPNPSRGPSDAQIRLSHRRAPRGPSRIDLSPLSPHSYKLFVVAKKVNSFGIKQIQTLLQKHQGEGYPNTSAPSFPSLVICAT